MASYNHLRSSEAAAPTTVSDQHITVMDETTGRYVYKRANYHATDDRNVIGQLSPNNTVPALLGGAVITFKLQHGIVDVLKYPVLSCTFLNNTGATATRASLHSSISRIDIDGPDGSSLWNSCDQELLFANTLFIDRNTYEATASKLGLTTTYGQALTSVASTASIKMILPIYGFFLSTGIALMSGAYNGELTIKITFAPGAASIGTGAELTCTDMKLLLVGKDLKSASRNALLKLYKDPRVPLSYSHLSCDRLVFNQALFASNSYQLKLSGAHGVCAFMLVSVRTAATIGTVLGAHTYVPLDTVNVLDGGSSSLIGSWDRDAELRALQYANMLGNNSYNNMGVELISFSTDPIQAWKGQTNGFALITGNESLVFRTTSTLSPANYVIDVRFYMYETLYISNGQIKSTRN